MGGYKDTNTGGAGYAFLTTQWSLIEGVQSAQDKDGALIGALLTRYWKPVYWYLRRRGCDNEQAKDLTQGFFHEIVLNRGLLQRADRSKGRFRAFLRHALDQYLRNENTKARARKRRPGGKRIPFDPADPPALPQTICSMTPEDCYNYAWLSDLLEQVLTEVRTDCQSDGLQVHWQIFYERLVRPILEDFAPPSLQEVGQRCGVEEEKKVANMLVTVKRRFQTALRRRVRNTVAQEDEVDDEVQELLEYFP